MTVRRTRQLTASSAGSETGPTRSSSARSSDRSRRPPVRRTVHPGARSRDGGRTKPSRRRRQFRVKYPPELSPRPVPPIAPGEAPTSAVPSGVKRKIESGWPVSKVNVVEPVFVSLTFAGKATIWLICVVGSSMTARTSPGSTVSEGARPASLVSVTMADTGEADGDFHGPPVPIYDLGRRGCRRGLQLENDRAGTVADGQELVRVAAVDVGPDRGEGGRPEGVVLGRGAPIVSKVEPEPTPRPVAQPADIRTSMAASAEAPRASRRNMATGSLRIRRTSIVVRWGTRPRRPLRCRLRVGPINGRSAPVGQMRTLDGHALVAQRDVTRDRSGALDHLEP